MSVDPTNANFSALVFLKIELADQTLRYATENVIAKDLDGEFYFWEGRIKSISNLDAGFNDFRDSLATVSAIKVELTNGKASASQSNLDSLLNEFWGNKVCTIFVTGKDTVSTLGGAFEIPASAAGEEIWAGAERFSGASFVSGTTLGIVLQPADIIFIGTVSFPNFFDSFNEKSVSFTITDQRYQDQLLAAPNVFRSGPIQTETVFPQLGDNVEGKTIPIIYGNFNDDYRIPIYEISGTGLATKVFKVADSSVRADDLQLTYAGGTGFILCNGKRVFQDTNDFANGTVTATDDIFLTGAPCYIATEGKTKGDTLLAFFGGTIVDPIEHPVEIIFDLLVGRLGVDVSQIDSTSFLGLLNEDPDLKARRWIGGGESVVEVLNDLCFEFGIELTSYSGIFYLSKASISAASSQSFDADSLDSDSYSVQTDPNRSYFNSANVLFSFSPRLTQYSNAARLENTSRRAEHLYDSNLPIEMKWNYLEVSIAERIGFLMYIFSKPLRVLSASFRSLAWYVKPNDMIDFTFHIFDQQKFLVRNVSKSLANFSTSMKCWDIGTPRTRVWAEDADLDPTDYTDAGTKAYGIWHADFEIIEGFNDTLTFTTDGTYTATVEAGVYITVIDLAQAIEDAMNLVSITKTVSVTYDTSSRLFTILTNDESTFSILWTSTPEIGRSALGFDVSVDSTASNSYTSDLVSIFDLSDEEAVTQWA